VSAAGVKVSAYFGERDLVDGRFLAERVMTELDRAGLRGAILMRGVEGFGRKHLRRTDRLLTLSEDLPVIALGVGESEPALRAAERIGALPFDGIVTTERIRLADAGGTIAAAGDEPAKLSVYLGRGRRIAGRPAHEWLVSRLRDAGVEGASVLLGVDGILAGSRRRAGFFARNADVPALVVSVGRAGPTAAVAGELAELPGGAVVTFERVHLCKRDGGPLVPPGPSPDAEAPLRRLTLYSSEQAHVAGRPVHVEAVRRLRAAGADGATALRGVWGFDGPHGPHGDTLRSLRRRVPTLTVTIDTPERCERWLEVLDGLTPERGLITCEEIPSRLPPDARSTGTSQSRPAGTS
jgi:PII-like signaling protein